MPDWSMNGFRRSDYRVKNTAHIRSGEPKASIIYKATGNLRAVQILLGTKIENTVRYPA
jgi:hypothetical protein